MKDLDFTADSRLLISLLAIVIACYAGLIGWTYHEGFQKAARGEKPLFTDFTSTYGAALLLRKEAPEYLYHPQHISPATEQAGNAAYNGTLNRAQTRGAFGPWMYAPTFIAFVLPLGFLPYFGALVAWLGMSAIPYLMAIRAMMDNARSAIWIAMAAPPFFYNVMIGQTSFLAAGLIGLGLHQVVRRPYAAGILIGLASVKPHLGILIPFALLAGGHWRVALSASATVVSMILASIAAFGIEPWFAFIGMTLFYMDGFAHGAFAWKIMTSVLSLMYLSGAELTSAWVVQWCASALCMVTVAWAWWRARRRPDAVLLQAAVLCSAIPLAVPMVFVYDLVVLVIALAALLQDMRLRGGKPWEALALVASMMAILLVKPLGAVPGIAVGMLGIGVLLGLSWWRLHGLLRMPVKERGFVGEQADHVQDRRGTQAEDQVRLDETVAPASCAIGGVEPGERGAKS